jgi:hypothetical protein
VSVLRCEVARELAGYWGLDCLHKGVTWIGSCFAGSLTAPGCSFVTLLGGGKLVGLGDAATCSDVLKGCNGALLLRG